MANHITLQNKDKNVLEAVGEKQFKRTFLRGSVPLISGNRAESGQMLRKQYFAANIF